MLFLSTVLWAAVAAHDSNLSISSVQSERRGTSQDSNTGPGKITVEDIIPLLPNLKVLLSKSQYIENEKCRKQTGEFLYGLHNLTTWSIRMLDSSAKVPSGILTGSTYSLGNFDECVSTSTSLGSTYIQGKYCLTRFLLSGLSPLDLDPNSHFSVLEQLKESDDRKKVPKNVLHLGFCIPSGCSAKDLKDFFVQTLEPANSVIGFHMDFHVGEDMCQVTKDIHLDNKDIVFISIMAFVLLVLFIGSLYDICSQRNGKDNEKQVCILKEMIISFSIPRNFKRLVSCDPSEDNLTCIHGIKFISMAFILLGHCALFISGGPLLNDDFLEVAMMRVENGILFNSQLFVETFFLISGFLVTYKLLKELDKRNVNILIVYIFRIIRLAPPYLAVIGFYTTIFYKIDSGPLWEAKIGLERERCLNSWWANILFLNNYLMTDKLCMFQSWFISVDSQLFFIGLLIIVPLGRRPVLGQILLIAALVTSIIIPFTVTYKQSLDPVLMLYPKEVTDISHNSMFVTSYIKTHMRATPFLCGVLLGYILFKFQMSAQKLPKTIIYCGWTLGPLCAVSSMFSVTTFYSPLYEYSALDAAIYATWDKVGWCVGVGWIIFACCSKNGGFVTRILGWKPLIALSRLTYCAYLTNGIVELYSIGTLRSPSHLSIFEYGSKGMAHGVLTFVSGFFLCLALDSPFQSMISNLLKRGRK